MRKWFAVAVALFVVGAAAFLLSVYLDYQYVYTKPQIASVGRTHGLNIHGSVVYLNDHEWRTLQWLFWGGGGLCLLAVLALMRIERRIRN